MDKEICLTIAGSDPSSGAGVQADIRTFEKCEVYPFSVITAITSQTADLFLGYEPVPIETLENQLKTLFENYEIKYAKTGMIPTREAVILIAKYLNEYKVNYVIDPVTISSAGARLAEEGVEEELKKTLFPHAVAILPNVKEAQIYSGIELKSGEFHDANLMKEAARDILSTLEYHGSNAQYSGKEQDYRGVVIKGGNVEVDKILDLALIRSERSRAAKTDTFTFYKEKKLLEQNVHGTGCVFSSALIAFLATYKNLKTAIISAEQFFDEFFETIVPLGDKGQVVSLDFAPEKQKAVEQVKKIYYFIRSLKNYALLIPEVRTNISVATENAQTKNHVAAIEGRISIVDGRPKAVGKIKFGVSDHTARLVLTAKKFDNSYNIVINMKYVPELLKSLQDDSTMEIVEFDRTSQPKKVKLKEKSTMQWAVESIFNENKIVPDIIWDKGAIGKEPIMRVFARNAEEMISKIKTIIKYLD